MTELGIEAELRIQSIAIKSLCNPRQGIELLISIAWRKLLGKSLTATALIMQRMMKMSDELERARQIQHALKTIGQGDRQDVENLVLPLIRRSWAVPHYPGAECLVNSLLGFGS